MNRKKHILIIALILAISFLLTGFQADFALAQEDSGAGYNETGLREIHNSLQLLDEEYINDVDTNELLQGTIEGLKSYLKARKVDVSDIENPVSKDRTLESNLRSFGKEYSKILAKYGGKFKEENLVYAALGGMVEVVQKKYDDPYTVAMNPEQYRMLQEQLNSKGFSGVGIFIELDKKHNNTLMVVEPIEGTPAQKAGIKPGDFIIRINGVSTRGMSLDNASSRIRGPEGTAVTLTLERKGVKKPFNVKLNRGNITVSSLRYEMKGDIGYIKLRFFGETTENEFKNALAALEDKGAKAMILDLRNNGGGYINAAVQVCSPFVQDGTVVTSVVNYRRGTRDRHEAYNGKKFKLPLVVLVNNYSASASEITAGCVQDLGIGTLIGSKTFGKGSVQTIHRIAGGGALKFTTAHYLTPKGKDINKKGIEPDIVVEMEPTRIGSKQDIQLHRALKFLKTKVSKK